MGCASSSSGNGSLVGVTVHDDVGFRSEPEGRTGFAISSNT